MNRLQRVLKGRPEVSEATVEWRGEKFTLRGTTDAGKILGSLFLAEADLKSRSRLWESTLGGEFPAERVADILLIHVTLVPDEGEYIDPMDVAKVFLDDGPLFILLQEAAQRVQRLGTMFDAGDSLVEVAVGNSSESPEESSGDSASPEPAALSPD